MRGAFALLALLAFGGTAALVVAPTPARAEFRVVNATYGSYDKIYLAYDTTDPDGQVVLLASSPPTPTSGGSVYLARASSRTIATVRNVVGRLVTEVSIITNPRGCDGPSRERAIENANCVVAGPQTAARRLQLKKMWYLPFVGQYRDMCINDGGDAQMCHGAPKFLTFNVNPTIPTLPSQFDMLFSYRQVIFGYTGQNGDVWTVTDVEMELPKLVVSAPTCTYPPAPTRSFTAARWDAYPYDAYSGTITSAVWTFSRGDFVLPQMRVVLRRTAAAQQITDAAVQDAFTIQLADAAGAGLGDAFFNVYYESAIYYVPARSTIAEVFYNVFDTPITFINVTSGADAASNCTAIFSIADAPDPPELVTPTAVSITNYMLSENTFPLPTYWPKVCDFRIGRYDSLGNLVYPYCAEFQTCGGYTLAQREDFPHTPKNVEADVAYQAYSLSCYPVYPKNQTFTGFGLTGFDGVRWNREYPESDVCMAPFLNVAKIQRSDNPQARSIDCNKQGMTPASRSQDACMGPRAMAKCMKGWYYFDQRCYYRFDDRRDTSFLVTDADAQQACDRIAPGIFPSGSVKPVLTTDEDQLAWILDRFLYLYAGSSASPYPYRVRSSITGQSCTWYYPASKTFMDGGRPRARAAVCGRLAYPLCAYHLSQYTVAGAFQSAHSRTIALWRDGQKTGVPHDGKMSLCQCELGSYGPTCSDWAKCLQPSIISSYFSNLRAANLEPSASSVMLATKWRKCFAGNRGSCREGQPNYCKCGQYFGPDMAITSLLDANTSTPCACPASARVGGCFVINGVFQCDDVSYLPCDGHTSGQCVVDLVTNEGTCVCEQRANTSPDAFAPFEPALGGDRCTCPIPKISVRGFSQDPPNVRRAPCGGRGTCCPISSTQLVSTYNTFAQNGLAAGGVFPEQCVFDNGTIIATGCACDNGWTGTACQCLGRINAALNLPVLVGSAVPSQRLRTYTAVVALRQAVDVYAVSTLPLPASMFLGGSAGCNVTEVYVSTSLDGEFRECVFVVIEGVGEWQCDGAYTNFVVVHTREEIPRCRVRAYTTPNSYVACGGLGHGNPFAQRFWAYETYRGPGAFKETVRDQRQAAAGCATDRECMCSPSYAGAGCLAGVSSLEISVFGETMQMTCGQSTDPPRGTFEFSARTNLGGCACNVFTTADYSGKIAGADGGSVGRFTGVACQCPAFVNPDLGTNVRDCGGNGECVAPIMPYGTCDYDLDDYINDPLYTPLIRQPGTSRDAFLQEFLDVGSGAQSIVTAHGRSWIFASGQLAVLSLAYGSMGEVCHSPIPVVITAQLSPESGAVPPQPAVAVVTVWTLQVNATCTTTPTQATTASPSLAPSCFETVRSTATCDPSVGSTYFENEHVVFPLPTACVTTLWCPQSWLDAGSIPAAEVQNRTISCLAGATWSVDATGVAAAQRLPYGADVNIIPICAKARSLSLSSTDRYESLVYGSLDCNNAVHRMVDWALWILRDPAYTPQCFQWPITPYSYVLGVAYGLFWDQVPDIVFNDDWREWPDDNFAYLSTVFNDVRCFYTDGSPLPAFGEKEMNDYLLTIVNRTFDSLYTPNGTTAPETFDFTAFTDFMTTYFNASFLNSAGTNWPPAQVDVKNTPYYVGYQARRADYFAERMAAALNDSAFAWYLQSVGTVQAGMLLDPTSITSDETLWTFSYLARNGDEQFVTDFVSASAAFARYYDPGVWQSIGGYYAAQTVTITFPANLTAFQIFNGDGTLCATLFNVVAGATTTVTCVLPSMSAQNITSYIYDIVSANSPYLQSHWNDTLYANARAGSLSEFLLPTMRAYMASFLADLPANARMRSVPAAGAPFYLAPVTSEPFWITPGFDALNTNYRIDPTTQITPQILANGTTFAQYWDYLTEQIVVRHTWPYNPVWAGIIAGANTTARGTLTCRAIDVGNPLDKIFLKDFMYSVLAPRRCTNDIQCNDFSRKGKKTCVYSGTAHEGWLNGDPSVADAVSFGIEGGCNCWWNATYGFFSKSAFCADCVPGWGPATNAEWAQVVSYQNTLASLLPGENNRTLLFDPLAFNASVPKCLLPFNRRSDGLLCSGHGTVTLTRDTSNASLEVFVDYGARPPAIKVPSCSAIWATSAYSGVESLFELQDPLWDVNALMYALTLNGTIAESVTDAYVTITVVHDEVTWVDAYAGESVAVIMDNCVQAEQDTWTCDFVRRDDAVTVVATNVKCVNDVLFDDVYHVDIESFEIKFGRWVTRLVPVGRTVAQVFA